LIHSKPVSSLLPFPSVDRTTQVRYRSARRDLSTPGDAGVSIFNVPAQRMRWLAGHVHEREANVIDKISESLEAAVADIKDGATVMIGGFGNAGMPSALIDALLAQGARNLTIVNNNAGNGETGLAALMKAKRVRKIICSFPRQADSHHFDALYRSGEIELELTPQGNLAERIRAAGAGIGGFFTPTGYGTLLAEGKETRVINGKNYVLESPIHADFALIKAHRGDRWGNLVYRKTARNFGPIMAMAAKCAIAQVSEIVPLGELDPEAIITPGIFVQRVVLQGSKQ
jgi:3-oxoadipate CoA-transferase alpha subunit